MKNDKLVKRAALVAAGIFAGLILAEAVLRIAGSVLMSIQESHNAGMIEQEGVYRILCIGESTTARGGEDSYPRQLEEILNSCGTDIRFQVFNKGIEGIETPGIVSRLEENLIRYKPHMVIAMTGVNDNPGTIAYRDSFGVRLRLGLSNLRTYKLLKILYRNLSKPRSKETEKMADDGPDTEPLTEPGTAEEAEVPLREGIQDPEKVQDEEKTRAEILTHEGHRLNRMEKYEEAEKVFLAALEEDPYDASAYDGLAAAYMAMDRLDDSERMLIKALEINPSFAEAYEVLGHLYNEQGRYEESEKSLRRALKIKPSLRTVKYALGSTLYHQKKFGEAEALLNEVLEQEPGNIKAYKKLISIYLMTDRPREAERLIRKTEPIDLCIAQKVYLELGQTYIERHNFAAGEAMLKKRLEAGPPDAQIYEDLIFCLREQGKTDEAEIYLKKMILNDPDNIDAHFSLAYSYCEHGDYTGALEIFEKIKSIEPANTSAVIETAKCYRMLGDAERAIGILDTLLGSGSKEITKDYRIYFELGNCYSGLGEFDKAIPNLERALELDRRQEPVYTALGLCYRMTEQNDKVYALAQTLIKEDIRNDRLYGFIAMAYLDRKETKMAEQYFAKANDLRNSLYNPATRYNIRKIAEMALESGARVVFVQYPIRKLAPLRKMFDEKERILFVDNEKVFKKALENHRYEEIFTDSFGGEFGHCTRKGNGILAKNIADSILKGCQDIR